MDEDVQSNDDRTEEATPERREEFRERGQVVFSRELVGVLILGASVMFMSYYLRQMTQGLSHLMNETFIRLTSKIETPSDMVEYLTHVFSEMLIIIAPLMLVCSAVAVFSTLVQTRLNFAWHRLKPDFSKMNPMSGLVRMVGGHAALELIKGVFKMIIVGAVGFAVLKGEWTRVPDLLFYSFPKIWGYWASITSDLFWGVAMLLVTVAAIDYFYSFITVEAKVRMTKKEVRDDLKRREVDPHVKAKARQRARELSNARVVQKTREATVIITNPTHFSIAVRYELGMRAPIVVAKGIDHLALRMREIAKECDIPIVENKTLARSLYALVEMGHEVPENFYKAVSEIIRYVFKLKNIKISSKT